jgi:DNA-binding MarR family transcriptional regulator
MFDTERACAEAESGYIPVPMEDTVCICTSLRRAALASSEFYDNALRPSGLKVTMYRLLKRASEAGRPNISELSRIVGLDRSTLGRNLRVLERQNLIRFEGATDERARVVVLTAEGEAALAKARPLWVRAQGTMRHILGEQTETLLDQLAKLNERNLA